jgi:type II secretory pathway pseudopilin PulG
MDKFSNTKSGYTIVEVLVSVGILIIFLPFAANMLTNSKLLASYSKHKIQAAYAAQQIIETERQGAFIVLAAGHSQTIPAAGANAVILDTKGNFSFNTCNNANAGAFCGTSVITVTPAVYTSTTGVQTTSTSVDHFVVTISWIEQIINLQVPMTETFAEDVANDTMLN